MLSGTHTRHFRLVFPTLAKNESPLTMIPQLLQVLGKKIENANATQDWVSSVCV